MSKALTPMLQQYYETKAQVPDAILFFRLGDFYEMFGEDAELAAPLLSIVLTSREAGQGSRIPMCGVPYHALDAYLGKLINAGYRVAICEQMEEAGTGKGIVKREIVRIVTPGTLLEGGRSETANTYLAAVFRDKEWGMAYCDLSTGTFQIFQTPLFPQIQAEMARIQPAELLLPQDLASLEKMWVGVDRNSSGRFLTYRDRAWFRETDILSKRFADQTPLLAGRPAARYAAAGLWKYVNTCLPYSAQEHFVQITPADTQQHMMLDRWTRRNLELCETLRDGNERGTLYGVLNLTKTALGSRLLRQWVGAPLLNRGDIEERLDMVEILVTEPFLRHDLGRAFQQVYDLERLLSKLTYGRGTARDLLLLGRTLAVLPAIRTLLSNHIAAEAAAEAAADAAVDADADAAVVGGERPGARYLQSLSSLDALADDLCRALDPNAPNSLKEGNMILPGYSPQIDELRTVAKGGKEFIAQLENRERERTRIRSMKIGYNKVFGYYLEVTHANRHLVPEDYERKQTLVNAERYITPELKDYEGKVLAAQEQLTDLEYSLFCGLKEQALYLAPAILRAANTLAELDVYVALAEAAVRYNYVRPHLRTDGALKIREGRHPVVERTQTERERSEGFSEREAGGGFIPNDTDLDAQRHLALLTGPNMAGKSTYMRQVALISLMAQIGSFVPAQKASLSILDGIYTRIGASDELASGQSTFMVEMNEVAYILQNATPNSLIILDEVGRGTSTFDGLSLAWAIAEHIVENPRLRSKTLFATHYHQMTVLEDSYSAVFNLHVAVKEHGKDVIFLHKILPGRSDRSYGLYVAKIAGLAPSILQRADGLLRAFEADAVPNTYQMDGEDLAQPSLFSSEESHPLLQEVRDLTLDDFTPRQALDYLYDLVNRLNAARLY